MPKFEAPSVIFHHHHILDQNLYNNELLQEEQTCNCRACHLRMKLLPNMCVLFFIGLIFPPIYFFFWGCYTYSIILYKKQLSEIGNFDKGNGVSDERKSESSVTSLSNSNPFSDKFELPNSFNDSLKIDTNYSFSAHCLTNKKFNVWCGRSIIAFSCQACLIVVVVCALIFKNDKTGSTTTLKGLFL